MVKKILKATICILGFVACSGNDNTAGVTEEENSIAFEVNNPASYDLWSFDNFSSKERAGHWFGLGDSGESSAAITFPAPLGDGKDSSMNAIVDACGGLCGTVEFEESSKPMLSAGVGFSLSKDESTVDASSWNGLCVTYESEFDMRLKFSLGKEASDEENMPFAEFPKESKSNTRCAKWENFRQDRLNNMSGEDAAKKLGAVLFEFMGKSKQKGRFNIKGLGSYKDVQSQQNRSSSSKPESSSSALSSSSRSMNGNKSFDDVCLFAEVDNLWFGPDGEVQVNTGLDNDTETQGYWFSVDDLNESEQSRFIWPVSLGTEYSSDDMNPIVEYCLGVCSVLNFESDGFAGIGFDIVGQTSKSNSALAVGDASAWGGVCVTYASETDFNIVMSNGEQVYVDRIPDMPKATLPKSVDVVTKCVEWSEFASKAGANGGPSQLASLLFIWNGQKDSQSRFNIMGVGKFQQLQNPECSVQENFVSGR